jgi:hypothetical protein
MTGTSLYMVYLPCFHFEASVAFYAALLGRRGVSAGWREHMFELGSLRLACVRVGGHEYVPDPVALMLAIDKLPSANAIKMAGGKLPEQFPFSVSPALETRLATDPSGNAICFVLGA